MTHMMMFHEGSCVSLVASVLGEKRNHIKKLKLFNMSVIHVCI